MLYEIGKCFDNIYRRAGERLSRRSMDKIDEEEREKRLAEAEKSLHLQEIEMEIEKGMEKLETDAGIKEGKITEKICPECNHPIESDMEICPSCGITIK